MVIVEYDRVFKKHFKTRIFPNKSLVERYEQRAKLFIKDRANPVLKDHKLVGKLRDKRSFSITGNVRVVYIEIEKDYYEFLDIGTHPQIYGM